MAIDCNRSSGNHRTEADRYNGQFADKTVHDFLVHEVYHDIHNCDSRTLGQDIVCWVRILSVMIVYASGIYQRRTSLSSPTPPFPNPNLEQPHHILCNWFLVWRIPSS